MMALPDNSEIEQAVIFLHIVKTAGTTLHRIIERQYRPEDVYWIGTKARTFDHFVNLSEARKAKIRMLRGHMVFGMHEHLPGPATCFTPLRDPVERAMWHDDCSEGAVEVAKRNLRRYFSVVGLVERFDETLYLLKRAYGWRRVFYTPVNVAPNRPRKDELSPAILDAVAEANQLDMTLYKYATQLFEEQVRQHGPSFRMKVKLFQVANRLFRLAPRR